MKHIDLMNELAEKLEDQGCEIFNERQNEFRVESPCTGMVISCKSDVIAVHPDGGVVIYDAKTGKESAAYIAQVQLCRYLILLTLSERWRRVRFEGMLVYLGGHEKGIPADSVDNAFVARVAEFIGRMTSVTPARRVPSLSECCWCDLTREDCPDRID